MLDLFAWMLLGLMVATTAVAAEPAPEAVQSLVPGGTLRAALNFGNPVLAQRDPATGEARGVTAELARELARRLGAKLQIVAYEQANQVTDALPRNEWDVAFLAIDPVRGAGILFTPPYVLIEGTYIVPPGSTLQTVESVDSPGARVVVVRASTYDLFLTRTLKHAELVRFDNGERAEAALLGGDYQAMAGVKQVLTAAVAAHPGLRPIPGRFMAIQQAVATPKGRDAGAGYLRAFVADVKASGFVARALAASGQPDAEVAPPE